MNIFNIIIGFFTRLLGFGEKVAENKGAKIPMQKQEIEAKSEMKAQEYVNKKEEVKEDGLIDDWIPRVEYYGEFMTWLQERHAKKQVKRIIDSGGVMRSVDISVVHGRHVITLRWTEGDKPHEYAITGKKFK